MRVKFPATVQFMRLGYEYQSLKDADIHPETRIFLNRFVPAIQRINSDKNLTVEQILATIEEIHNIIKNNDMGKEFLSRLLDQTADIKLIDFDRPADNDFAIVDELTFGPEAKGSFRPDITVLVNGIPLGFLEVKKPNNEGGIQKEFHRMLDERLQVPEFKKYFNMLQFVTFSNNMEYETDNDAAPAEEVRAGSFYSTPNGNRTFFSFFREENPKTTGFKEIYMDEVRYILKDNGYSPSYADTEEFQTNLQPSTPCNRFVTSFFDIPRMMYLLQYGFFYVDTIDEKTGQPVTQKHIMRYPQFFASQAILKRIDGGGKSGIIFHTQGSGKTELSAFSTRIIRDYYSERGITAKFYYVVDRLDLLIQVRDEMRNRGLNAIEVNSRADFEKELKRPLPKRGDLRSNGEIVVVNIQKFTDALPQVSNVYDAKIQRIFFVDEAHRSYKQTGQFFKNLMLVDDNAIYLSFYFRLPSFKKMMLDLSVGATMPSLNTEIMDNLILYLPSKEHQDVVASLLDDIDSKISNNNAIAAELEGMAKDLYDYWFVQFDFPDENGKPYKSSGGKMVWNEELKREIPEGWEVDRLGKHISSNRGISYNSATLEGDGVPMINLASFGVDSNYKPAGIKTYNGQYDADKILHPFDLIMCNTQQTAIDPTKDIIGKAMLVPDIFDGDVVSSHHVTTITPDVDELKYYLYGTCKTTWFHKYIVGFASGTNILGLDFKGFEDYLMPLPPMRLLKKFATAMKNIESEKNLIITENAELASLRDFLLPMLMNGQVKVKGVS